MNIPEAAWPYLVLQQGRLDHLKADRAAWRAAYVEKLQALFAAIEPHLPERCRASLDVGGGMGGIDVLIARRYPDARVGVLDGRADPPAMVRHAQTFNDLSVTGAMLASNGVRRQQMMLRPADNPGTPQPLDLVVSFGSWCFHYPPAVYRHYIQACCHPGTRLILEVRKGRLDWQAQLTEFATPIATCGETDKFVRMVYAAR